MPKLVVGCLVTWIWGAARQQDFPGDSSGKESACNSRDLGSIPGWGAKIPYTSWPKKLKHKAINVITNPIKT